MEIKNQRILVTGINDMVGHHLLNMLRSMGATVSGIGDLHGDIGSLTYLENEIIRLDVIRVENGYTEISRRNKKLTTKILLDLVRQASMPKSEL